MATPAKKIAPSAAPAKVATAKKVTAKAATATKAATPTTRKTTSKVVSPKPAAAKKITAPEVHLKPSTAPKPVLTSEQRNHYVSVAAFYIAERRGFTLGNPQDDWLAAEAEIDRLIASGHFSF